MNLDQVAQHRSATGPVGRHDLRPLFSPRSIAVVGASADGTKLSGLPLTFLRRHGYGGRLYPINPRVPAIDGLRCYPSLAAVGEPIDLALIILGAERVLATIDECLAAGVRVAIVHASGFAETGDEGRALQAAMVERIAGTPLRILGPNCVGIVNLGERVAATFSQSMLVDRLLPGRLAFLTQSGAIGGSAMDLCHSRGIGLSHWVATGNQADLDVVECARYLLDDRDIDVLALYLEGLKDPGEYLSLVRDARALGKPLLVLKSGRSSAGSRAAASHTGAMAGDAAVFAAVSRQYGAILVDDVEEMLDCAAALLAGRPAAGPGVGVVSSSGGVGVLLADEADRHGLALPDLADATRQRLSAIVPPYGSVANPVDVTASLVARLAGGEGGLWRDCFSAVAADPSVDLLMVGLTMVTGQVGVSVAEELIAAAEATNKPVLVTWLGADLCRNAFARLRAAGVPTYPSTARGMRAAAALVEWGRQRARPTQPAIQPDAALIAAVDRLPATGGVLTEWECRALLGAAGIPAPGGELVHSEEEAAAAARRLGTAVVLKVQSPEVLHKTESGGVRVGVAPADAASVYGEIVASLRRHRPDARFQGVLVQELVADGWEVLVGITRHPQFGPTMAFGLGGVLVEALGDVAFRHLPLSAGDADGLIRQVRAAHVLDGYRNRPAADRRALAEALERLSALQLALGDRLLDLEINPLLVRKDGLGVCALDCLIRLAAASC